MNRLTGFVLVCVLSIASPALGQDDVQGHCVGGPWGCGGGDGSSSGGLYAPDGLGARIGTWIHNQFTGDARRARATELNNQGVQYYRAQNYDAAIPLYRQAFALNPNDLIIRGNLISALIWKSGRDWRAAQGNAAAAENLSRTLDEAERLLSGS